jgi:hypothetical protein
MVITKLDIEIVEIAIISLKNGTAVGDRGVLLLQVISCPENNRTKRIRN